MVSKQTTSWIQKTITLKTRSCGNYDITQEVTDAIPEIKDIKIGLCNLFLLHTSASLCIMENWDDTVKEDMETFLNKLVPQSNQYKHSYEGPDDMPAHIKTAILGPSHSIPISDGKLKLGTWQGIWLNEHRTSKCSRELCITIQGSL